MPLRVVITGGAGFVGSTLGLALHRTGHDVVLFDDLSSGSRDNLIDDSGAPFGSFVEGDVRDASALARIVGAGDVVVHLAGIAALPVCQSDPGTAFDVNVGGTVRVLDAARRARASRVIFASTSAVYENVVASGPLAESDAARAQPDLVYAMTKAAAERACEGFAKTYGLDVIICRFFNVYGPHQDVLRTSPPLTGYIARELVAGRAPRLFNRSPARRDYIYSADLTDLMTLMISDARRFAADVFNVGSGEAFAVRDIFETMRATAGLHDLEPVYADPAGFWGACVLSSDFCVRGSFSAGCRLSRPPRHPPPPQLPCA